MQNWGKMQTVSTKKVVAILYSLVVKLPSWGKKISTYPQAREKLNVTFFLKSGTPLFSIYIVNKKSVLKKMLQKYTVKFKVL